MGIRARHSIPIIHDIRRIMGWEANCMAIELLRKLDQTGSINSAAKAIGVSYKSAWQKLEQLNNIVPYPIFIKQTGGSGGGGTALTEQGHHLLRQIGLVEKGLCQLIDVFSDNPGDAIHALKTLQRIEMKISARNIWFGQIVSVDKGCINNVVTIQLKGGDTITSVITDSSATRLGLKPGNELMVMVKASNVLLGNDIDSGKISARNLLRGVTAQIVPGDVNAEVSINLPGGSTVISVITANSTKRLGLKIGDPLCAIIKASDVLLALA